MRRAKSDFGAQFMAAAKRKGVKQREVAAALNMSRPAVANFMTTKQIGLESMRKLAKTIGCRVEIKLVDDGERLGELYP